MNKEKLKTDNWAEWSLTPHTEDEIREKVLTDYNNVCFAYVCEKSPMTKRFAEELAVLSAARNEDETAKPWLNKNNVKKYYGTLLNLRRMVIGKKYEKVNADDLCAIGLPKEAKKEIKMMENSLRKTTTISVNFNLNPYGNTYADRNTSDIIDEVMKKVKDAETERSNKRIRLQRNRTILKELETYSKNGKIKPDGELWKYISNAMEDRLDWNHITYVKEKTK
jgi:hypothetical protein